MRTTTSRDMRCPTLDWVSYLLTVHRYLLLYIGELHRISHWPPTMCHFMMLFYLQCNIRMTRASGHSPPGRVSCRCLQSTSTKNQLNLREHTIRYCFFPFDSQSRADHTVPYWDPPVWWDLQSEIPEWLCKNGLIVWPNIGVCGQEYS